MMIAQKSKYINYYKFDFSLMFDIDVVDSFIAAKI